GTPATRASVIETLLRREYIERRGKALSATAKGRALIDAVPAQALKSAQLTGQWEAKLNRISTERASRGAFMAEVRQWTAELVGQILSSELTLPESMSAGPPDDGLGPCPLCGTQVTEIPQGFTCQTGRACAFFIGKRIAKRKISKGLVKVLLAGKTSKTLKGFKSKQKKPFQAALRLDEAGKVVFVFDRDEAPAARPCPKCTQGHLIRGKRAWGCSRWRQGCDYVEP
ncbi:MAG: topoisomerase C-terminal repeat-containing protein, partial [Myxococcota bacterium]